VKLQDRELCHCLAGSSVSTGEGRMAQQAEVLMQEQDGYRQGFKTQQGNGCVSLWSPPQTDPTCSDLSPLQRRLSR